MDKPLVFAGSYTRPDDMSLFVYEVTVTRENDSSYAWVARVTCDSLFRGRPNGVLADAIDMDPDSIELAVRDLVETAIRDRVGVG